MKKFFIGLGIFFVLAGIVFCVADTKDTSARAQALYDAPVVTCLLYTSPSPRD